MHVHGVHSQCDVKHHFDFLLPTKVNMPVFALVQQREQAAAVAVLSDEVLLAFQTNSLQHQDVFVFKLCHSQGLPFELPNRPLIRIDRKLFHCYLGKVVNSLVNRRTRAPTYLLQVQDFTQLNVGNLL